jgi:hypothetical protein
VRRHGRRASGGEKEGDEAWQALWQSFKSLKQMHWRAGEGTTNERPSGWLKERPSSGGGQISNPSSSPPSRADSVHASPVMERPPRRAGGDAMRAAVPTASPLQPLQPLHHGGAHFSFGRAHLALVSADLLLAWMTPLAIALEAPPALPRAVARASPLSRRSGDGSGSGGGSRRSAEKSSSIAQPAGSPDRAPAQARTQQAGSPVRPPAQARSRDRDGAAGDSQWCAIPLKDSRPSPRLLFDLDDSAPTPFE